MEKIYPLQFTPIYKNYLWGGQNLEKLGRVLPEDEQIAESWEIAAHQDGMTRVKNGSFAGWTLQDVFEMLKEDLVGSKSQWAIDRNKFPLLVKLIDANKPLSVQVHPNDAYARKNEENELGKTEMWVVLDAKPGTEIIYGLTEEITPALFRQAIEDGTLEKYLHRIPIKVGDHICVPSGTLHAILDGALLVEIQQNSNITYRVFDWNRVDEHGQSRQLHLSEALDVINFGQVGSNLPEPVKLNKTTTFTYERLCQNPYFTTDRLWLKAGAAYSGLCDGTTLEIWGILSGKAHIAGQALEGVSFILLPAALGPFEVVAENDTQLLRTYQA